MAKLDLVIVCGPTASGKSACAIELCKRIGGELLSADSMQIYHGMNIGTAKPSRSEQAEVKHHLIDIAEPNEQFSAAAYQKRAREAILDMKSRGVVPVVCGGTGLYIDAILKPLRFSAKGGGGERKDLELFLEREGKDALHRELAKIDPDSADRLHVNDTRRVMRAIEVHRLTGQTMTQQVEADAKSRSQYEYAAFALDWPREVLYARIEARVDAMIKEGLVEEVRSLLDGGLSDDSTAMQALGYKEIVAHLRGRVSLTDAVEQIKQRTRNYAKRQLTWFRRDPLIRWISAERRSVGDISREMADDLEREGGLD